MLENIYIILDKPQMGENIGAAARSMANFGLINLRIISPRDGWPNEAAYYMATFGKDILDRAEIYENFEDAIKDLNHVFATFGRELTHFAKPILSPRKAREKIEEIGNQNKVGIVFGCERVGLNNDQLSMCNSLLMINTAENAKSMNLAQAVTIIAYELSQMSEPISTPQTLASLQDFEGMINHLDQELSNKGFFQEPNKKKGMMINIRNMFNRCMFNHQEIQTLRGIIRSLSK
ncbi:MAG: RNA methyltransferase [Alphaproteobacteria bacterium]|nr:RNA methyltransferase [Alphaproteobacteria bacterium]OJV16097.1 MAG: hypothetical protein BGO27_03820 [Alphaproteobacteria bacterium 33-17]